MVAITFQTKGDQQSLSIEGAGHDQVVKHGGRQTLILHAGEQVRLQVIATPHPVVDADTFRDKLVDVIRGAWEEVQAGGEDLSEEATVLWHDAMHAVGAGPPREVVPPREVGPPADAPVSKS